MITVYIICNATQPQYQPQYIISATQNETAFINARRITFAWIPTLASCVELHSNSRQGSTIIHSQFTPDYTISAAY